jgi:hypothetical protein
MRSKEYEEIIFETIKEEKVIGDLAIDKALEHDFIQMGEAGIDFTRELEESGLRAVIEDYHSFQEDAAKMDELDDGTCGGVPFFFNTETEEWICGEASYDELVSWATG